MASSKHQNAIDDNFIVATHYYGFEEWAWPVNYLNSLPSDNIHQDLKTISDMGFNTIILLVSWSEFEPSIGTPNRLAYQKLNEIIRQASTMNIKVMVRIPYLWSLLGSNIRERIAYAIVGHDNYRRELLRFVADFRSRVVDKNPNVISVFGSWEDYYVAVRDLFFTKHAGEYLPSSIIRRSFGKDTGIDPDLVEINGKKYDVFLNWLDARIQSLSQEIGEYGYEIRIDSDPITTNGNINWHSHSNYFENRSGGRLISYWAPYFGQSNSGEELDAESAVKGFAWSLDLIGEKSSKKPFIDQLNFFDNSPLAESNAKIKLTEVPKFFDQLSDVLIEQTDGYAFWTIRDYSHNLIVNSSFSDALSDALDEGGWVVGKGTASVRNGKISIAAGSHVSQMISNERLRVFQDVALVTVVVLSGNGQLYINGKRAHNLAGTGRYQFIVDEVSKKKQVEVKIENASHSKNPLIIDGVSFSGHTQFGKIFSERAKRDIFYSHVSALNTKVNAKSRLPCRGFTQFKGSKEIYVRGVLSDGWSTESLELCFDGNAAATGVDISYFNPAQQSRVAMILYSQNESVRFDLKQQGVITLCPNEAQQLSRKKISFDPAFIPSKQSSNSADSRQLGVFLRLISPSDKCEPRI